MTAKKDDDTVVDDVNEAVDDAVEEADDDSTEDDNWSKMKSLVSDTIDERLEAWQAKQKTISSHSPRKRAATKPTRKQGFLTGGFFSGLNEDK